MKKETQATRVDSKQSPSQPIAQRNRVEVLAEEYAALKRAGEAVNIDQYIENYPELANEIRELFPMMEILDRAVGAPESERTTESLGEIGSGTRLGEYRLIKPIGRGGMGVVYQAEHVVLGSSAAVKLLPAGLDRPKLRERFQREASAAARMHHPNIVRVFDYGVHGETLYYVMELVEGCGLNHIIDPVQATEEPSGTAAPFVQKETRASKTIHNLEATQPFDNPNSPNGNADETDFDVETAASDSHVDRSKLTTSGSGHDSLWSWVARIGVQAADALDYAHSAGVIHRDIKPANLMIDADEKIHVMDFGLAKVADDHSLTATGDLLGTLRYMPPESFSGRADHRSDIYSLGLTLYELLINQPAFAQVDRAKLIPAITNGQIAALRKELPKIPRDLETVIHKSVATAPGDRYQSAAEFREDLTRFLKGEPVHARRTSMLYKAARWTGRNRMVSGLAVCVLALAAIAGVAFSISENRKNFAELQQQLADEKQQLADERQQSADRIANVFDRFLRNYDASYEMRTNISVEDLLEDAADLLDDEFENDPLVEAKLRMTVGNAHLWFDNSDTVFKGVAHLERAVELLKKHQGDPQDLARALTGLVRFRRNVAEPSEANPLGLITELESTKPLLEEALAIHESIGVPGLHWAESLHVMAGIENSLGMVDEATNLSNQALAMLDGDASDEATRIRSMLYGQLAWSAYLVGNYDQATEYTRKSIDLSKQLNSFFAHLGAFALGDSQLADGRFTEGEATFRQYFSADPYAFWPRVTTAILLQGDWERAIEWSQHAISTLDLTSWNGLRSRRTHAQYLRLSGDDVQAIKIMQDVLQEIGQTIDPDSAQHKFDYIKTSYYLARVLLFSEDQQKRQFAIDMLKSIRGNLDPTAPSSTIVIRLGYAIAISQFPDLSAADIELIERCIELVEQDFNDSNGLSDRIELQLEFLLAKAFFDNAKGNRDNAITHLRDLIADADGLDASLLSGSYREPYVALPTLRIAEDILAQWLCEDGKPDEAVQLMKQAVQSRVECEYPAEHQINFAKARLGRLLIKLNRKDEARTVLSELAAITKDGPDCFRWLEDRIAADLKLTD